MRGQQTFLSLFGDELIAPVPKLTDERKGRDSELDRLRNELLLHRYYYYGKFTGLRYSVTIQRLSSEFFVSDRRIQDIIQKSADEIQEIRNTAPSVTEMRTKWPNWVWK